MNPITIALCGLAGAGKDSVADALVTHAGFSKIAFADPLRLEIARAFKLSARAHILSDRLTKERPQVLLALRECTELDFVDLVAGLENCAKTSEFMNTPRSPRQIMQWWGTEFRRASNPNYWSSRTALRIADMRKHEHGRVVITDCRFVNEANAVRLMGGEIWQVVRPGQVETEGVHASRNDGTTLKPDAVLINGTDVPGLCQTALRTLQQRHGGALISIWSD